MGMDVYGRRPSNKLGEYFRASVWAWRPLHFLIYRFCSDLIDAETMMRMASNDGAGPNDADVCNAMADRLERWLNGFKGETFTQIRPHRLGDWFGWHRPNSNYKIHREHIMKFINFLRHCGGFWVLGTTFLVMNLA